MYVSRLPSYPEYSYHENRKCRENDLQIFSDPGPLGPAILRSILSSLNQKCVYHMWPKQTN